MKFLNGCFCVLGGMAAFSMAQPNHSPSFEVVSIKPSQIVPRRSDTLRSIRIDQAQVNISAISALDLLVMAFRTPTSQISGPSWLAGKVYEIRAKVPDNTSPDALPEMFQSVCIDRLGLAFHRESRVSPVYSLVVVKGGPSLTAATTTQEAAPPGVPGAMWTPLGQAQMVGDGPGPPKMVGKGFRMTFGNQGVEFQFSTLGDLIAFLALESDRPIVDNTALEGVYQIKVTVTMGGQMPVRADGASNEPAGGPLDIYSDSLAKMGLRLSPGRAPIDTLVVDHMNESPTQN